MRTNQDELRFPVNSLFNCDQWSQKVHAMLYDVVIQTSGAGWSISDPDISALAEAKHLAKDAIDRYFDNLTEIAQQRQHNLLQFKGLDVVSLGFDCFGRTIPTRWGLKRPRCLGEPTGPFDLAVHMPGIVSTLITQDFEGYLDPESLHFDQKLNYCVNRKMQIGFNHECGEHFALNGFEELIRVYSRRIESFRKMISTANPLLLIAHSPPTMGVYPAQLERLKGVLSFVSSRREADTVMLIIKTFDPLDAPPEVDSFVDGRFHFCLVANPAQSYIWHDPHHFMTSEGFEWEKNVANQIKDVALTLIQ